MTDTKARYGTVPARDGDRIYVEPSLIDTGGIYIDVSARDIWLTEEQAKKLRKLIKEAIKAGLVDD